MKQYIDNMVPVPKMKKWNWGTGTTWFTLIEILVSMTILSVMMVSVIMIYVHVLDVAAKYYITIEMRNNIKSVVEDIAEEVRKNDIVWVKSDYSSYYNFSNWSWSRLKVWTIEYKIKKSEPILDCSNIKNICTILKFKDWVEIWPLSNSKVSFTNLSFEVSGSGAIPKVTLKFIAKPAIKSGVKINLIKNTKLIFQTTISERALKVK